MSSIAVDPKAIEDIQLVAPKSLTRPRMNDELTLDERE